MDTGQNATAGSVVGGAIPSGGGGGLDIAGLLDKVLAGNQANLGELARKAATPIPGGHSGQMPLRMDPTPSQPGQGKMIPTQGIVGKKNARAAGIGNAIIGTMNAVSAIGTEMDNKKKLAVASSTQTLLTAQSAMDQAKQILQADPNNKAAQDAVKHNTNVMNGILSDDKMRKAIAKGFQIDFTDPKANETLEHQGVAQGKQMAEKTLSYADQFNEKTPQTMTPNVQAQAELAAKQAEQKMNTEAVKAMVPMISAQIRAKAMDNRTEGMLDAAKLKAMHDSTVQQFKADQQWQRLQATLKGRQELAHTEYGYKLSEIAAEGTKEMNVFKAKLEEKQSDPASRLKAYNDFSVHSAATLANLQKTVGDLENQKALNSGQDKSVAASYNEQINMAKEHVKAFQDLIAGNKALFESYDGKQDSNGRNSVSNSSVSTESRISNADTYAQGDDSVNSDDDEDPD